MLFVVLATRCASSFLQLGDVNLAPITLVRDLAERVSSGINIGDLAKRVNSGTNLVDLAERVASGTNHGDLAERVASGTNLGDLVERVNSGTNPKDLAERVNSGTNPGDLAERVGMTSSDSSSSVRVISSPGSGGVSLGDPEASPSGASSGPPSRVDARALRDLEVMKAYHDLDTAVTEGSLVAIRERYNFPAEYGLLGSYYNANPGGRRFSTREAPKASSKRLIDAPTKQVDDPARRPKKVKVLTRRHKSRHGEGGSRSHSKGKEPVAPAEEPESPIESDEEDASPGHHRPRSMKNLLKTKVHKDDAGYYALHMSDLSHQDLDKVMKAIWGGG
ncbi:hypothetical protein BHM03_00056418 [Ensete ventricosum]|nr:hypothetical protein BHM03_00056418 [Ensete ventricosum]